MAKTPLAFLSYAHSDDEHEGGKLLEFAKRLRGEVQLHWGEDFPIFIDRSDLKWGHEWKARINDSLDSVTFLIPIVTPGFLKSEECRRELQRFLERERELKRADLVLPVYYVRCPVLEDAAKRAGDQIAETLHERQYTDWLPYRFESWTTPAVGRAFERMALGIVEVLERGGSPSPAAPPTRAGRAESQLATPAPAETISEKRSVPKEPPTMIVDQMHRGDYTSIADAIQKAVAGTKIVVRSGYYREALVIEKPLEIVGEGNRDDIIVEATGGSVILFKSTMARVANLTLRQTGIEGSYAVDIAQGRLDLEDCDIRSRSLACVAVHNGAEPRIRRNRISDCEKCGIMLYESGAGLIEENDIVLIGRAGIQISTGANPTVRKNRIHDGKMAGVVVYDSGLGVLEENEILSNAYSGVEVKTGGNPTVRGNRIQGNSTGVFVWNGGQGTFENNVFTQNKNRVWDIAKDCEANVKRSGNVES